MLPTLIFLISGAVLWAYKFKDRVNSDPAIGKDGRVANPAQSWQDQTEMRGQHPAKRPILRGVREPVFETYKLKAKKGIGLKDAYQLQRILDESREPEIPFRTLKSTNEFHPALKSYYMPYMHPHLTKIKITHDPQPPKELPDGQLVRPHLVAFPMNQAHALATSQKTGASHNLSITKVRSTVKPSSRVLNVQTKVK